MIQGKMKNKKYFDLNIAGGFNIFREFWINPLFNKKLKEK
jgi:hypothetical protein